MKFLMKISLLMSFLILTHCTKCSEDKPWSDEEYAQHKKENEPTAEEKQEMEAAYKKQLEEEYQKIKKAFEEFVQKNPEYKKYPTITDPGSFMTLYSQIIAGEGSMKFTTLIDRLNKQIKKQGIIFENLSFGKDKVLAGATIPKKGTDIMMEPRIDILKPYGKRKTKVVFRNEQGIAEGPCHYDGEATRINAFVKEIDNGTVLATTDSGESIWLHPDNYDNIEIYKKGSSKVWKKIVLPTEGTAVFKVHKTKPKAYVRVAIFGREPKIFADYQPEIKDLGTYLVMEVTPSSFKFLSDKEYYLDSKRIEFKRSGKGWAEEVENKNYRFVFVNDICT